jgi:hypothetical protein
MGTDSTKQREKLKTVLRIVFKVFSDHLARQEWTVKSQDEMITISNEKQDLSSYLKGTLENSLEYTGHIFKHLSFVPAA